MCFSALECTVLNTSDLYLTGLYLALLSSSKEEGRAAGCWPDLCSSLHLGHWGREEVKTKQNYCLADKCCVVVLAHILSLCHLVFRAGDVVYYSH